MSIGFVAAALGLVHAKYVTTSQMVLLPPLSQPNANYNGVVNPYMGLQGLQSMAAVVASAMSDGDTANALKQAGVTGYSVQYDSLSGGPILIVQATSPSPAQATAAITALDKQLPMTVARLQGQASIAPKSFITAKVIARPSAPAKSGKTQLRVAALALVVGIVLTLLVISIIDGWRIRRQDGSSGGDSYRRAEAGRSAAEADGRPTGDRQGMTGPPLTAPAAPTSADSGYRVLANESARDGERPFPEWRP